MPLAVLTLTNPAMLWGLLLAGIPLAAHLLNQFARRRVIFPSTSLLRLSAAQQSRLFRLRRWIVLALRCAFVALVAFAFARPTWFVSRSAEAASERSTAVVLLIDASVSTTQNPGSGRIFDALRSAAARTLDGLAPGVDAANVIVVSNRPTAFFPRLSPNLPALREQLRSIEPGFGRADFPRALALAGEMLASHPGRTRVVILSDLQATGWSQDGSDKRLRELLGWGTEVVVVEPPPAASNVALSRPRSAPPRPLLHQDSQCVVRVTNDSSQPREVRLAMQIEGEAEATQTVSLAPREEREVAFPATWTLDELRVVRFAIPDDGLSADNAAWLVVRPARRLPALVVSDDDPNDRGRGAYFLARALAPLADEQDRFDVRVRRPSQVQPEDLVEAGLAFVDFVSDPGEAFAARLVSHARSGGSVLVFAGDPGMARTLDALDRAAGEGGALPFAPGSIRDLSAARDPATIASGRWRSRLLRDFDEQSQLAFSQIRFHRVMSAAEVRPEADVLLAFADGTPALAARQLGAGQLVVASFSPDVASSDIAKYGSFVALIQALARELRPQLDAAGSAVGESWRSAEPVRTTPADGPLRLVGPDGQPAPLTLSGDAATSLVQIDDPDRPGVFRFETKRGTLAAAAIHVDPRESRLAQITAKELGDRLAPAGTKSTTAAAGGWGPHDHRGAPLWPWLIAASLVAAALELGCVAWWSR